MDWKKLKNKVEYHSKKIWSNTVSFCEQHKEECVIAATVVLPLAVKGINSVSKVIVAQKEEHHRLLTDYDPSTGWYNELRHPLSVQEKAAVVALKKSDNLTMTEALLRMNLLK